jgi:hypothetical protein
MGMRTVLQVAAHTGLGYSGLPGGCRSRAAAARPCARGSAWYAVWRCKQPPLLLAIYLSIGNSMLWCHAVCCGCNRAIIQCNAAAQPCNGHSAPTAHPLTRLLQYCGGGALPSARAALSAKTACLRRVPRCACVRRGRRARMRASHVAHVRHDARVPRDAYLQPQSAPAGALSSTISSGGDSACRSTHAPVGHCVTRRNRPRNRFGSTAIRFDATRPDRRRPSADRRRPSGQLAPAGSSAEPSGAQRHPLHPAQPNVLRQVERCRIAHSLLVGAASQHCVLHRCILLLQRVAAWRVASLPGSPRCSDDHLPRMLVRRQCRRRRRERAHGRRDLQEGFRGRRAGRLTGFAGLVSPADGAAA